MDDLAEWRKTGECCCRGSWRAQVIRGLRSDVMLYVGRRTGGDSDQPLAFVLRASMAMTRKWGGQLDGSLDGRRVQSIAASIGGLTCLRASPKRLLSDSNSANPSPPPTPGPRRTLSCASSTTPSELPLPRAQSPGPILPLKTSNRILKNNVVHTLCCSHKSEKWADVIGSCNQVR